MVGSISGGSLSWMMPRPDSLQIASKLFSALDTKNQGYIEKSDLESALSQAESSDSTSAADELFTRLDSDGNGKITQTELSDSLKQMAEQLDAGFNNLRMAGAMPPPPGQDDDTGFTQAELTSMVSEIGSTDSKLSALMSNIAVNFDEADTDGDGRVNTKEAMTYQQSQGSNSLASTSSTTDIESVLSVDDSETASSYSVSSAEAEALTRSLMQLLHAYGVGGQDSGQSGIYGMSLSVTA